MTDLIISYQHSDKKSPMLTFSLFYPPAILQWLLPLDQDVTLIIKLQYNVIHDCSMHDGKNSVLVIHCLYVCYVALSQLMQNKFGEMALITASGSGHLETAKLLIQQGALVNYQRKVSVVVCGWCTWCARQITTNRSIK